MYCAVNMESGKVHFGTLEEVIAAVFDNRIVNRTLIISDHNSTTKLHTYSQEWTTQEMQEDSVRILAHRLIAGAYPFWKLFKEVK